MIYADYNATTPLDPEVRAAMNEALDVTFGNPSSIHSVGQAARRLVDRARAQVAGLIGAAPDEIVFTSGGTEADNLAVLGVAEAATARGIVISAVEHKAVLDPCKYLQSKGHTVTFLPVDRDGRVDLAALEAAVKTDVALVSLMLANNDTGTIQPVAEAVQTAKAAGALVHTDAVQAAGKLPIDVSKLGVSLLSRRTRSTDPKVPVRFSSGAVCAWRRSCTVADKNARCDQGRKTCRPSSASARPANWRARVSMPTPAAWPNFATISRNRYSLAFPARA
jgi:cysteine sulfinate desulfinase/cysteine desulfurase-like protein